MPFIEIKQPTNFIRIHKDGNVTISAPLVRKYFNEKRIKILHDSDTHKIGFQPSEEGYKITLTSRCYTITCHPISRIVIGEFYPEWSKKDKMLIISYIP